MQATCPNGESPRLDFSRTSRRLRLVEKARDNAQRELPPPDDDQLDDAQQQVVEYVRGEADRVAAAYYASLVELNRRIRELDVAKRLRAVKHAPTELSRQLRELSARVELGLMRARGEYESARAEYEAFRAEHGIRREPRYPVSKLAPIALLLAVAVAKAGLAGHFFAESVAQCSLTVLLVCLDVALAYQLGRAVPWVAAPTWRHRLMGIGAVAAFVAWTGGFNLLALTAQGGDPQLLAGAGALLSTMAALIGFCSDDRIPGYGRLHRRLMQARSELDYWKTAWTEGAAALHAHHQERIETATNGVAEDTLQLERSIQAKRRLLDEVRDFARNFENAANALLRLYRDTNQGHRSTPPPAYFDRTWRLHLPDDLADSIEDDLRRLAAARRMTGCAEHLAQEARTRAQQTWQEFLGQSGESGTAEA